MDYKVIIIQISNLAWEILKTWWWLPLPVILFFPLRFFYLWYVNNKYWGRIQWVNLELRTPKDVERPLKAMDQVMTNFWTLYDPADFKETWVEGKFLLPFFLEIAGIDGNVHFFLRIPKSMRTVFESAIYSQYPDVEVTEVEDYIKRVPQNIPNEEWDMWGCNFKITQKEKGGQCYPIKTYASFFEPTQEVKEEKRIDPLSVLIEGMSRLKKGEQLWFQMRLTPVPKTEWYDECKTLVNKLVQRPEPPKDKSITASAIDVLAHGIMPYEKKKEEPSAAVPLEMRITPGERDFVSAIENKMAHAGFRSNLRMIYLGKKDAFFKPNLKLILNFSVGISTQNLNGLMPAQTTKVVAPYPFRERKLYMKKKVMFRRYSKRWIPNYPFDGGTYILTPEEVATLYHFPSKVGAPTPTFSRIESKKSGPPPSLPIE